MTGQHRSQWSLIRVIANICTFRFVVHAIWPNPLSSFTRGVVKGWNSNFQTNLLLILKVLWMGGRIKLVDVKMVAVAMVVRVILISVTAGHGFRGECSYVLPPGSLLFSSCRYWRLCQCLSTAAGLQWFSLHIQHKMAPQCEISYLGSSPRCKWPVLVITCTMLEIIEV